MQPSAGRARVQRHHRRALRLAPVRLVDRVGHVRGKEEPALAPERLHVLHLESEVAAPPLRLEPGEAVQAELRNATAPVWILEHHLALFGASRKVTDRAQPAVRDAVERDAHVPALLLHHVGQPRPAVQLVRLPLLQVRRGGSVVR